MDQKFNKIFEIDDSQLENILKDALLLKPPQGFDANKL